MAHGYTVALVILNKCLQFHKICFTTLMVKVYHNDDDDYAADTRILRISRLSLKKSWAQNDFCIRVYIYVPLMPPLTQNPVSDPAYDEFGGCGTYAWAYIANANFLIFQLHIPHCITNVHLFNYSHWDDFNEMLYRNIRFGEAKIYTTDIDLLVK